MPTPLARVRIPLARQGIRRPIVPAATRNPPPATRRMPEPTKRACAPRRPMPVSSSRIELRAQLFPLRTDRRSTQSFVIRCSGTTSMTRASSHHTIRPCVASARVKRVSSPPLSPSVRSNRRPIRRTTRKSMRRLFVAATVRPVPVGRRRRLKNPPAAIHGLGGTEYSETTEPTTAIAWYRRLASSSRFNHPIVGRSSSSMKASRSDAVDAASARLRADGIPAMGSCS